MKKALCFSIMLVLCLTALVGCGDGNMDEHGLPTKTMSPNDVIQNGPTTPPTDNPSGDDPGTEIPPEGPNSTAMPEDTDGDTMLDDLSDDVRKALDLPDGSSGTTTPKPEQ